LNGGYGWLEVMCRRCLTRASLPLDAIRRPRDTPVLWSIRRMCLPGPSGHLLRQRYPDREARDPTQARGGPRRQATRRGSCRARPRRRGAGRAGYVGLCDRVFFDCREQRPRRLRLRVARLAGRVGGGVVHSPQAAVGLEEADPGQNKRLHGFAEPLRRRRLGIRRRSKPSR
jgi:hypothetical protein